MKNLACINAIDLSVYAYDKIGGGKSAIERACEAAWNLPGIEKVVLLADKNASIPALVPAPLVVEKNSWNIAELLDTLQSHSKEADCVFYYFGDCPFIDPGLAFKMQSNHAKYFADYSFADGYPYGVAPEIISPRIFGQLRKLSEKSNPRVTRESIFDIIKKDINSFDVETELSPVDLRFLRISLCADRKRNFLLIERIAGLGPTDSSSLIRTIQAHPAILRTLPAFYGIQIVERCPYACSYCPYPKMNPNCTNGPGEMDEGKFHLLMDKIEAFSEDAYIDISLWGDPAFHSNIVGLAGVCCSRPLTELVIETSGIGWKPEILDSLSGTGQKTITWIMSLDAPNPKTYERLRGEGFDEAYATTERLMQLFPGRVYVQAVRMRENEDDVELFYNRWKTKTDNLIVQKYDYFCGFLDDKKITDLSPVQRMPCWHLKRDMSILMDGTATLCKEDLAGSFVLGNAFSEDLADIWEKGNAVYMDHTRESYMDMCSKCDEYYTFNF
jgi:spiro-SPASM protein